MFQYMFSFFSVLNNELANCDVFIFPKFSQSDCNPIKIFNLNEISESDEDGQYNFCSWCFSFVLVFASYILRQANISSYMLVNVSKN